MKQLLFVTLIVLTCFTNACAEKPFRDADRFIEDVDFQNHISPTLSDEQLVQVYVYSNRYRTPPLYAGESEIVARGARMYSVLVSAYQEKPTGVSAQNLLAVIAKIKCGRRNGGDLDPGLKQILEKIQSTLSTNDRVILDNYFHPIISHCDAVL